MREMYLNLFYTCIHLYYTSCITYFQKPKKKLIIFQLIFSVGLLCHHKYVKFFVQVSLEYFVCVFIVSGIFKLNCFKFE